MTVGINGVEQTRVDVATVQSEVANVDGSSIPAMVGTSGAATTADGWDSALATILDNFSATNIGYLANINNSNLATIVDISSLTSTIIGYINNANLGTISDISSLDSTKIGYLDQSLSTTESNVIASIPSMVGTDSAYLATPGGRIVCRMDFASEIDDLISVDDTAGAEALPSVVVAEIPSGATIFRVIAWLSIGQFEDSSGSENKVVLASTEHIQVKETAGGSYTDAIKLFANQWLTPASGTRGGSVMIGNIDIASEVNANDTYDFQWEGADVTAASLLLRDVQTGLIVYFTT